LCSIYFSARIISKETSAQSTVLLTSFAGGLGWLYTQTFGSPDISLTPFTYISTFQKPHKSLAVAFYLLSLASAYKGVVNNLIKNMYYSGLLFCAVILFYPYYILSYLMIIIIFVWYTYRFRPDIYKKLIFPILITTLPLSSLYSFYLLSGDSFSVVLNPHIPGPHILLLLPGYGLFLVPLLFKLFSGKKTKLSVFY
jgi:hypothetical protein